MDVLFLDRIYRIDDIQCRFTEEFSAIISSEDCPLGCMKAVIGRHRIWLHVILMIGTLGIYCMPLALWIIHKMNRHIKSQWAYEV